LTDFENQHVDSINTYISIMHWHSHFCTLNMHKMGLTKIGNTWLVKGDQGAIL